MDVVLIILAVFGISFALSIFQIVRQGIGIRSLASAIIAGTIFGLVLFMYLDVADFRDNFKDSEKLFLLQDESQQFIAGFSGVFTKESALTFLDAQALAKKQAEYDTKDTEAFVGPFYKVFVVSSEFLASFSADMSYGDLVFTHEDALRFITSEQPISAFVDLYLREQSIPDPTGALKTKMIDDLRRQVLDDTSMRGLLFAKLFSAGLEREGSNFFIVGIAADQVRVFKETPLFLLMRYMPASLLKWVVQAGEEA